MPDTPTTQMVARSDHGTHEDAVRFALEVHDDTLQTWEFLNAWSRGDLGEWPEFYEWLDALPRTLDDLSEMASRLDDKARTFLSGKGTSDN